MNKNEGFAVVGVVLLVLAIVSIVGTVSYVEYKKQTTSSGKKDIVVPYTDNTQSTSVIAVKKATDTKIVQSSDNIHTSKPKTETNNQLESTACFDYNCFLKKVATCTPNVYHRQVTDKILFDWTVTGKNSEGTCDITVKTTSHTNSDWVDKTMTCKSNQFFLNRLGDGRYLVDSCKGELAAAMIAKKSQEFLKNEHCPSAQLESDPQECVQKMCLSSIETDSAEAYCSPYIGKHFSPVYCGTIDERDGQRYHQAVCLKASAKAGATVNQCTIINDPSSRSHCLAAVALQQKDPSVCSQETSSDYKKWCEQVALGKESFPIISDFFILVKEVPVNNLNDWIVYGDNAKIVDGKLDLISKGNGKYAAVSVKLPDTTDELFFRLKYSIKSINQSKDSNHSSYFDNLALSYSNEQGYVFDLFPNMKETEQDSLYMPIYNKIHPGKPFNIFLRTTGDEQAEISIDSFGIYRVFEP